MDNVELNQAVLTDADVKNARIKRKERKLRCEVCGNVLDRSGKCPVCLGQDALEHSLKSGIDLNPLIFFMALFAGPLLWVLDASLYISKVLSFGPAFLASLALGIVLSLAGIILGLSSSRKEAPPVKGAKAISIFNIAAWILAAVYIFMN
jgi:hypothetical protein